MKSLLPFFLLLLLPAFGRADDVTVTDSPDWQPIPVAQAAAIRSRITRRSARLVDASEYSGGGRALLIAEVLPEEINKPSADRMMDGFVHGIESSGARVTDRQPARIGPLPGISVLITGQRLGQSFTGVGYAAFTDHEMYAASIYGAPGIARTDPEVASYLARLQVAPAAVPGDIDKPAGPSSAERFGEMMFYVVACIGAIFVVRAILRRNRALPPPLPRR